MASATGLDCGALVLTLVQSIVGMVRTLCATKLVGGGYSCAPYCNDSFSMYCWNGLDIMCFWVGVNGVGVLSDTASIGSTTVPPLTWY